MVSSMVRSLTLYPPGLSTMDTGRKKKRKRERRVQGSWKRGGRKKEEASPNPPHLGDRAERKRKGKKGRGEGEIIAEEGEEKRKKKRGQQAVIAFNPFALTPFFGRGKKERGKKEVYGGGGEGGKKEVSSRNCPARLYP